MDITEQEVLIVKLLHYFITTQGYKPIVVHGTKNEIWLENLDSDYKIIRIVSNHIHNNEQYNFDVFKTKKIVSKIKKKTFFHTMNVLNIFTDLGNNVTNLDIDKSIKSLDVKNINDIKKYQDIYTMYPNILNCEYKEDGINLFLKLTDEINRKSDEDAKKAEKIFKLKTPNVTYLIILLNIITFFLMYFLGNGSKDSSTLINFGANYYPLIKSGQYYRLITSSFLHIGFLHLICNMYALYVIGNQIENLYGKTKFILIYLFSALCGSMFSMLFNQDIISAGASTAIFGLLGSMLYFGYYYRIYLGNVVINQLMPVLIFNLLISLTIPGVDLSAHIGGLIGGLLISKAVGLKEKTNNSDKINGLILSIIYLVFLIYILFIR